MKKLQNLNDPLFKTLEVDKMKKILGGDGRTWTLPEVKLTHGQNDCGVTDSDAAGQWDGTDQAQQ